MMLLKLLARLQMGGGILIWLEGWTEKLSLYSTSVSVSHMALAVNLFSVEELGLIKSDHTTSILPAGLKRTH